MARRRKETTDPLEDLTDLELDIMQVFWTRGDATAAEVTTQLQDTRPLADTTVHTVLANLRKKGVIEPIPTIERATRYRATVEKRQVADRRLKDVLSSFFGGSPRHMVLHLLKNEAIDEVELQEIRKLFREEPGRTKGADSSADPKSKGMQS
jgi:BlaI family penicillinase repressor